LPIFLPIRPRQLAEAFAIEDSSGTSLAYIYFDEAAVRRSVNKRLLKAEAEELAKVMAAAIRKNLTNIGGGGD
jgi:hypothetical protein